MVYSSMASVPKRSAHDLDLLPGVCLKLENIERKKLRNFSFQVTFED